MTTKITNLVANLRSLWKRLPGLSFTGRRFFSYTSSPIRSVHVLDNGETMDDVRMGLVVLLRTRDDDDANVIAVKTAVAKLWGMGEMPLLTSLNAEALVVYYNEKIIPLFGASRDEDNNLMVSVLLEYESLAVFMRMVKAIKNVYFNSGWLDEPSDFLS